MYSHITLIYFWITLCILVADILRQFQHIFQQLAVLLTLSCSLKLSFCLQEFYF